VHEDGVRYDGAGARGDTVRERDAIASARSALARDSRVYLEHFQVQVALTDACWSGECACMSSIIRPVSARLYVQYVGSR
jgi:hypothetical protein